MSTITKSQNAACESDKVRADESIVEYVSHVAGDTLRQVNEEAQFAMMRADETIVQHPRESVMSGFVLGAIFGATVTALFMRKSR